MIGLFNNNSNPKLNEEGYSEMVSHLCCLRQYIQDQGFSILDLISLYNNNLNGVIDKQKFFSQKTFENAINCVKSEFDKIESSEDKPIWDELNEIVKKYNLTNPEQLIQKVKELRCADEVINQLITNINSVCPNQIKDANSLVIFVSELVKQHANLSSIQQDNNMMFTNLNATLNENAILKAQNEQMRQMLRQLGQNI